MLPHEQLMGVLTGMWAAQAAGTFARLEIADAIAAGATTAPAIAKAIGASEDGVYRLVRACATIGLVKGTTTVAGPTTFALTEMGELLRSDQPMSFQPVFDAETAPGHWLPWGRLDECVKTGQSQVEAVLGTDIWDHYAKHPAEGLAFSRSMGTLSNVAIFAASAVYQYPAAKRVVDVGGAHGGLLAHVLDAQPSAKGVLMDLAHVVAAVAPRDRVEVVAGDFFTEVPAGGDLYLLKFILHDWDDARCTTILKNVRRAMAPGGTLVIIEMLIPEDGTPSPATLIDLNMLALLPGRERTQSEMKALLEGAGFGLTRVVPTPSPFFVLEAS